MEHLLGSTSSTCWGRLGKNWGAPRSLTPIRTKDSNNPRFAWYFIVPNHVHYYFFFPSQGLRGAGKLSYRIPISQMSKLRLQEASGPSIA